MGMPNLKPKLMQCTARESLAWVRNSWAMRDRSWAGDTPEVSIT